MDIVQPAQNRRSDLFSTHEQLSLQMNILKESKVTLAREVSRLQTLVFILLAIDLVLPFIFLYQ